MLHFDSDYMETCCPKILERLSEINFQKQSGYGTDEFSKSAKDKIKKVCDCPNAEIFFLTGGTQTNATVLDGLLQKYQGVIAAKTGHIAVHEAGAIEAGGHKVIELPGENGKLSAKTIDDYCTAFFADGNKDHMVNPGVVYISQPTEYGTLYSLSELNEISRICKKHNQKLFVDGARLAYALGCPKNDVQLADLARLTDAFYIGGTKAAYTELRKFLIKDGYVLLQSEVFMRITNNRKGAEKHLNRIKPYIPNTGTVRIMRLTEKQFCNMGLYQAEEDYQESIVGINDYIML